MHFPYPIIHCTCVTSAFCFPIHYLPAVPHAPTLAVAAKLHELQLNCSFGSEAITCNVTIEINGTMMSATGNSTFYGLVSNTLYPTSARAINRCGDYSKTSTSHWTCKFNVASPSCDLVTMVTWFWQYFHYCPTNVYDYTVHRCFCSFENKCTS